MRENHSERISRVFTRVFCNFNSWHDARPSIGIASFDLESNGSTGQTIDRPPTRSIHMILDRDFPRNLDGSFAISIQPRSFRSSLSLSLSLDFSRLGQLRSEVSLVSFSICRIEELIVVREWTARKNCAADTLPRISARVRFSARRPFERPRSANERNARRCKYEIYRNCTIILFTLVEQ